MKKKLTILAVAAVALLCILIYFLQPRAIVRDADLLDIHRVVHNVEIEEQDITGQVDLNLLKKIIAGYKCSRTPVFFAPYQQEAVVYEIDGTYAGRAFHLLLGEINIVYESGDQGGYRIQNSAALLSEIKRFVEK